MVATFKETLTSLQDKNYGAKIIAYPLRQVIWYWTKYLLLLAAFPLALSILAAVHFVPQLPRYLKSWLPQGEIAVQDGRFSTSAPQPLVWKTDQFAFIVDSQAAPDLLDSYPAGALILADRIIFKESVDRTQIFSLNRWPDFSLSKDQVVGWVSRHQGWLLALTLAGLTLFALILTSFFWFYKLATFFLWAVVFWFLAARLKKTLSYLGAFKLVIYASVLSLLISAITFFAPHLVISFLGLILFLFFALSWLWHLK